jgi:hypothetical protein
MAVDMQPLGARWLVTSHRFRSALLDICIWRLGAPDSSGIVPSSCVIRIKPDNAFTFEAAFQEEGGDVAIISVLGASPKNKSKG